MATLPVNFRPDMGLVGGLAGCGRAQSARLQSLAADAPAYTLVANNERASSLVGVHPSPQALECHRESIRQQIEADLQRNMADVAAQIWDHPPRYDQQFRNQYGSPNPQGPITMLNPIGYDEAARGTERTELMEATGLDGPDRPPLSMRAELQKRTNDWLDGTPKPRKSSVRTGWKI